MASINGLGQKNGLGSSAVNDDRGKAGTSRSTSSTSNTASVGKGDSVQWSEGATNVQQLTQALAQQSSFDQAKVDRIKTMIEHGEYAIDPQKIAERFRALEGHGGQ